MEPFAYPGAWIGASAAALLVGVPILIHLINMMRHRRVEWAAMEFLLISQKKNRTWVLLKQLLLLLMRMAAVAVVVFLVAQPRLFSDLGKWFGSSKTHHIVLLDDSFSMSDRWGDTSAFDEAKAVVGRIASQAAAQATPQSFTLLRFSQAGRTARGTQPDVLQETVDRDFSDRLREKWKEKPLRVSQTAAEPIQALKAITQLLSETESDRRVVYVVSDFRARQWNAPADVKKRLAELTDAGARLYLVNCTESARPNLAITDLALAPGTRAAGVSMSMEVTVKNFGETPVTDVPVALEQNGEPQAAVTIPQIPPREAVRKQFRVHFPTAGKHEIVAGLPSDAVTTDNHRYGVLDLPMGIPVLLIDGDPEAWGARFLSLVLESDKRVRTGIIPQIERPRFLSLNRLDEFHAVYLTNIERLDASAIKALEDYVAAGGGLAMFLGPRSGAKFINDELYRDGKGFFPVPLSGPAVLRVDHLEKAPDLEIVDEKHPVFRIFVGQPVNYASMLIFERYFAVPKGWAPKPDSTVRVIAQLRNRAPLAIERRFGKGRVIVFLTTAAPVWNNWAKEGPSFPATMLQMQAYLANQPLGTISQQVGTPLEVELDPGAYQRQVRFVTPDEELSPTAPTDAVPGADGTLAASLPETDLSGIYKVRLEKKDGKIEERRFAYNVDAGEGDLRATAKAELFAGLDPIKFEYAVANEFQYEVEEAGYNLFHVLLYVLILLLIGEQILAWSASYHPPSRPARSGKGGVR